MASDFLAGVDLWLPTYLGKVFISFRRGGFEALLRCEVLLYTLDAWYFPNSAKIDYEIRSTRLFYKPQHMRPLEEIRG